MLRTGETEMGKWSLKYFPPAGGKYYGIFVITDQRLLFSGAKGRNGRNTPIDFDLARADISSVKVSSKGIKRRMIISIKGREHIFSRPFFNWDSLITTLKK